MLKVIMSWRCKCAGEEELQSCQMFAVNIDDDEAILEAVKERLAVMRKMIKEHEFNGEG